MQGAHELEQDLFAAAIAFPPAERGEFLRSCTTDTALRDAVEALVREHEEHPEFLAEPSSPALAGRARATNLSTHVETPGTMIGVYRLIEKLGEGGHGAVYRAEQTHPVRREVALKIIKLGMDTRAVVARFEAESQALARMEHPNIAHVFDAGATAGGRPFFVMELVRGTRITDYCDEHRLTVRERLELFRRVCDALQHAHQKGVIHRDLKPSNILVTNQGGEATPKIIDFGIAKATQGRLVNETVVTDVEGFIGTPDYMSPEQADRRSDAIDTRSDIYSLGVVLYELLTGCTPLTCADIRQAGIDEIRRRIREVEPLPPALRVRTLDAGPRERTAERRGASTAKFGHVLTADLDSVVMKCLEKSPARRYESASALAQDIGRFLKSEPVSARSAGQWYVWGKFVRRYRVAFATAAAIIVLLIAGITVSTLLLFREKATLERAVAAERAQTLARETAEKASRQAKTEATRSARATEFMTSVLKGVKPAVARGRDKELLRELLDEAAARLDSALQDEPEVEAELRDVIGEAFWHLDEPRKAAQMHRRALALHEQALGPMHAKVGFTLMRLGLFEMYHGDEAEAEKIFTRTADIRVRAFGPQDPRTLDAMFSLANMLNRQKRYSQAAELFGRVREVQMHIFPSNDLRLLLTEFLLADLLHRDGSLTAAERAVRGVIANYPADTTGQSLSFFRHQALGSLGRLLLEQGRIDEAIETLRYSVASSVEQGQPHIGGELLLGQALHLRGRCDEALTVLRTTTESARQTVSRDTSRRFVKFLADATRMQAACLAHTGRAAEAEPLLREACALSFRHGSEMERHPAFDLAKVLRELGKPAEADVALENALRQAGREGNEFVFQLLPPVYRSVRAAQGEDRAEALIREQLASEAAWLERSGPVAAAPYSLAVLCAAAEVEAFDLIAPVARARLAWWEQHRPAEAPAHAYRAVVGEVLLPEDWLDEAERTLLVAAEAVERTKHYWRFETLWRAGRLNGALARFYAVCTRPEEPGHWRQLMTVGTCDPEWELTLARTLFEARRYREAGEILPGARTRLEERLASKPDNDRLKALVAKAAALGDECWAKLERSAETASLVRGESK